MAGTGTLIILWLKLCRPIRAGCGALHSGGPPAVLTLGRAGGRDRPTDRPLVVLPLPRRCVFDDDDERCVKLFFCCVVSAAAAVCVSRFVCLYFFVGKVEKRTLPKKWLATLRNVCFVGTRMKSSARPVFLFFFSVLVVTAPPGPPRWARAVVAVVLLLLLLFVQFSVLPRPPRAAG